jgi:uncharacterized protein YceH (UPF0502 family)
MELTAAEGRVLGCLIEKAATAPDAYPVTLDSLRLACNQAAGRHPVVAYDDRTVEDTLLTLKTKGLARFVLPTPEVRSTRYSHRADQRWRMAPPVLAVLSVLLVGGPLTTAEVEARARRLYVYDDPDEVGAVLDTLAARTPSPFAARLDWRRTGPTGPTARWAEVLTGPPPDEGDLAEPATGGGAGSGAGSRGGRRSDVSSAVVVPERITPPSYAELAARVAELERRLAAATERPPQREQGWRTGRTVPLSDPGDDRYGGPRRWGEGAGVGSGVPRERALPVAGGPVTSPADLAERLADIERRLARIEAELGALR